MTTTIKDLLGDRPLVSIAPDATLRAAAHVLADCDLGAVPVIENGTLLGILSERDIVFRAAANDLPMADTLVRDVMTPDPVTVPIDAPVADTLKAHLGADFRHMPVTQDGSVVGVLSYRDIPAQYVMMYERFQEMAQARADGM